MTDRARVSVVLPARDASAYLRRAIDSCLGQSFSDLELIVVNDGSTDATGSIANDAMAADSRVRVLHLPSCHGVGMAHNLGARQARGEYLARMDADDVSLRERIARQVALLDAQPELDACSCLIRIPQMDAEVDDGRGFRGYERWINGLTTPSSIACERFVESPVVNPTAMIRRDVFERLGGYAEVDWPEDYDFWLRLLAAGGRVAKVDEVLFEWSDLPGRLTRTDAAFSQDNFLRAKAHYIAKLEHACHGVSICGAGPIGKRLARLLVEEGTEVRCFFEVHPRRIGERIAGIRVRDSADLGRAEGLLLSAVGLPGGRDQVRAVAARAGYVEGENFYCVA